MAPEVKICGISTANDYIIAAMPVRAGQAWSITPDHHAILI
jgi:hypothetical protein